MLLNYIPVFLVLAIGVIFGFVVVMLSKLLGPQRPNKVKNSTYESGMKPIETTNDRLSIKYYLVAMLFIIFDIEVIFVYPWAVQFRKLLGSYGFYAFGIMLLFLVVLELAYLYAYKKGALKWD